MKVIVVGGGILGLSLALELRKRDAEVTIVERGACGGATSSAAAGFLSLSAIGDIPEWGTIEAGFERYALDFYQALDDAGYDIDYKRNGTVWVDLDGSQDLALQRLMRSPIEQEKRFLIPSELEDVTCGLVRADSVARGVYYGSSADIYGPKAAAAVLAECRRMGARVLEGVEVRSIETTVGQATGVATSEGPLTGEAVVLATGPWINDLLEPLGVWIPVVSLLLWRAFTGPCGASPLLPQIYFPGHGQFFVRELQGGYVWGASGFEAEERLAYSRTRVPVGGAVPTDGFAQSFRLLQELRHVMPTLVALASHGDVVGGAPTYSTDGRNLLGPVDSVGGLYVMSGCNQSGFLHGPGMSRMLAQHLVGEPQPELRELSASRFQELSSADDVLNALFANKESYFH